MVEHILGYRPRSQIYHCPFAKGIKFQDGTLFNAEAVKYNLEAVYVAAIWGSAILAKVASYDVLDDYALRLNPEEYDATLIEGLASGSIGLMASPTAMKKQRLLKQPARTTVLGPALSCLIAGSEICILDITGRMATCRKASLT